MRPVDAETSSPVLLRSGVRLGVETPLREGFHGSEADWTFPSGNDAGEEEKNELIQCRALHPPSWELQVVRRIREWATTYLLHLKMSARGKARHRGYSCGRMQAIP